LHGVAYFSIVFRTCAQYKMAGRVLRGVDNLHYQCTNNEVVTRAVQSAGDESVDSKLKTVEVHGLTSLDAWIHTGKSNFYLNSSFSPRCIKFMNSYCIMCQWLLYVYVCEFQISLLHIPCRNIFCTWRLLFRTSMSLHRHTGLYNNSGTNEYVC